MLVVVLAGFIRFFCFLFSFRGIGVLSLSAVALSGFIGW